MAKPANKIELVNLANNQYKKLIDLINSFSEEEKVKDFIYDVSNEKEAHWLRDKNIKDVLIHLYEWQQLLLNWVESNQNKCPTPFLPSPYTWKNYGVMNVELFWKKHLNTSYNDAIELFISSHAKVLNLINKFNDEELFTKSFFSWTGTTSLGQYCLSTTSSHYEWAIKKLKKHSTSLKKS